MDYERLLISLAVTGAGAVVKGMKEIDNIAEGKDSEVINELSLKVKEIFANNREKNEGLHYNGNKENGQ